MRVEDVCRAAVEIVDDRARQDAVEREAADQQQRGDPERRDDDHAPSQRSDARDACAAAATDGLSRRRHRGGLVVQRGLRRLLEAVAEAADGGDHVGAELLADAGDEHLDRVGIAVEVLVVDMLDQLGPADHLALVVHQVG